MVFKYPHMYSIKSVYMLRAAAVFLLSFSPYSWNWFLLQRRNLEPSFKKSIPSGHFIMNNLSFVKMLVLFWEMNKQRDGCHNVFCYNFWKPASRVSVNWFFFNSTSLAVGLSWHHFPFSFGNHVLNYLVLHKAKWRYTVIFLTFHLLF